MTTPGGIFDESTIEFTNDIETTGTTNVLMTFMADSLIYTGTTGSTDEVVVSGIADPILPNDSANKNYVDTRFFDAVIDPGIGTLAAAVASTSNISIYMRSGTYNESSSITLPDNTMMAGNNRIGLSSRWK